MEYLALVFMCIALSEALRRTIRRVSELENRVSDFERGTWRQNG